MPDLNEQFAYKPPPLQARCNKKYKVAVTF